MGYFKTLEYWGGGGGDYGFCNFGVSKGRRTKFCNVGCFDVLSSKMALVFNSRLL